MQVEKFYKTESAASLPLIFITSSDELSNYEKNTLLTQDFNGSYGDLALISDDKGQLQKVYVGRGADDIGLAIAHIVNKLPEKHCYHLQEEVATKTLVGWALAQYKYDSFKKCELFPRVLVVKKDLFSETVFQAKAVFLVRDLINAPTNHMLPMQLADACKGIAQQFNADFKQYVGEELLEENFPAIYAVGAASSDASRLIHLSWGNPKNPKITLVGKGVCFDSGGLQIKPARAMLLMKKDMGGAANALGLAYLIMSANLPVYLQVLIPAVENAIGPKAYRPGDILTMRNGLTVEIDNTDAEGRLVLADALSKACEDEPDCIIDFATLTGAARSAVGTEISAMFTNSDEIASSMVPNSFEIGDPIWRLPLYENYMPMLDSTVADIANSGQSPYAGAITAALFLQRFVVKDIPWLHFDIMAWNVKSKPGKPVGGEAMGINACFQYIKSSLVARNRGIFSFD